MTPAINILKKKKLSYKIHEYKHDPKCTDFGKEASKALNLNPHQVFKTLLVNQPGSKDFFVAIIPVSSMLNLKSAAKALKLKKLELADPNDAQRVTGYLIGGISPIGQKKRLKTIIDESALDFETIFVSGGKRGLDLELSPKDLSIAVSGEFHGIKE